MEQLKVSGQSKPKAVAGAIANILRKDPEVEVQVVGAGALNQAVKAVCIARGYLAPGGMDAIISPAFTQASFEGKEDCTALRLTVERRVV